MSVGGSFARKGTGRNPGSGKDKIPASLTTYLIESVNSPGKYFE